MNSIQYIPAATTQHLQGILQLQQRNLSVNISPQEATEQGFVTVVHTLQQLEQLNHIEPHFIAIDDDKVVAYLLAMTAASKNSIPVLMPMFNMFGSVLLHGQPVSAHNYLVIGQVCVDKDYRGRGLLHSCYTAYGDYFKPRYPFAITEIDIRNTRSIRAHEKIGFTEISRYTAPGGETWSIVVWEW